MRLRRSAALPGGGRVVRRCPPPEACALSPERPAARAARSRDGGWYGCGGNLQWEAGTDSARVCGPGWPGGSSRRLVPPWLPARLITTRAGPQEDPQDRADCRRCERRAGGRQIRRARRSWPGTAPGGPAASASAAGRPSIPPDRLSRRDPRLDERQKVRTIVSRTSGSHVHCSPISGSGTRLCPCGLAMATPQAFTMASHPRLCRPGREFPARSPAAATARQWRSFTSIR